ncbi:coiled-coil domain-containing protein 121 [Sorex fumeus]|uniref:coiled-coil domain-containing protein 121 n=1 Tax=Sorex fumeus TaxID=62283 RepID=UPI0024ADD2A7|nr:coiled-coil domain-containing protein 121 [Sorex fumeus]
MKTVHFLLKPLEAKGDAKRKSTAGPRPAAEREERPGDWPFGFWPEPNLQDPGTEKLRRPSTWRRHSRAAHRPRPEPPGESSEVWGNKFSEDVDKYSRPYLYLVDSILKSKTGTQIEKIRGQIMPEIIRLNTEIKEAQIQQKPRIKEIRQLYTEISQLQSENKFFLDYLTNKTEEYRKQPEKLWASYLQKVREMERRKQVASAKYEAKFARLKAELLEKEKVLHNLKKCLEGMKNISTLKEKQENKILALKEEEEKVPAKTNAKIQEILVPFLLKKTLLEEQLNEPDIKWLAKSKVFGKTHDVESAARHRCVKFSRDVTEESERVQKELLKLIQRSEELEAAQKRLETQKRQLQQKEWYLEGVVRGRKHLQRRRNWRSEEQGVPKATVSPPHSTKSRINLNPKSHR